MDKKTTNLLIVLLIASVILFAVYLAEKQRSDQNPLNELQKEACLSADLGGTCKTKLSDLEFVSTDECCKYLGKCCK
jgi:uncharacterized membrane protein YsdA (DUF1294 family)